MSGSFAMGRQLLRAQKAQQALRNEQADPIPCEVIVAMQAGAAPKIAGVALSSQGAVELVQLLKVESQAQQTESSNSVEYVRIASVLLPR